MAKVEIGLCSICLKKTILKKQTNTTLPCILSLYFVTRNCVTKDRNNAERKKKRVPGYRFLLKCLPSLPEKEIGGLVKLLILWQILAM